MLATVWQLVIIARPSANGHKTSAALSLATEQLVTATTEGMHRYYHETYLTLLGNLLFCSFHVFSIH